MDTKKLKAIIKNSAPKETFGTDPKDPWSTKAGITESSALNKFLLSRGIQPQFVSKDVKVAHAKSNQFKMWLRNHQFEEVQMEDLGHLATKGEGGKTSDRKSSLEKAKSSYKEVKTPRGPGSHNEETVAKLMTKKSLPQKQDHDPVSQTPKMTQEETLDEISLGNYKEKSAKQQKELQQYAKGEYGSLAQRMLDRRKRGAEIVAKREKQDQMKKEEVELDEEKLSAAEKLQRAIQKQREKSAPDRARFQKRLDAIMPSPKKDVKEDVGDAKAAVNADGMPNPQLEPVQERKKQLSKAAKMVKSLYKEDLYDHEKEDKSVATYGKKPKLNSADPKDSKGENKPQAAGVLTGGTTLTGQKRDDIEIDPMMRARPGQPDPTKKKEGEKDDKKDDKKKDK